MAVSLVLRMAAKSSTMAVSSFTTRAFLSVAGPAHTRLQHRSCECSTDGLSALRFGARGVGSAKVTWLSSEENDSEVDCVRGTQNCLKKASLALPVR